MKLHKAERGGGEGERERGSGGEREREWGRKREAGRISHVYVGS